MSSPDGQFCSAPQNIFCAARKNILRSKRSSLRRRIRFAIRRLATPAVRLRLTVVPFSRSVVASRLLLLSKDTSAAVFATEITLQAAHQRFRFLRRARPRSYLLFGGMPLGNHHSQAAHLGVSCGTSRLLRRRLVPAGPVASLPEFFLTLRPAFSARSRGRSCRFDHSMEALSGEAPRPLPSSAGPGSLTKRAGVVTSFLRNSLLTPPPTARNPARALMRRAGLGERHPLRAGGFANSP